MNTQKSRTVKKIFDVKIKRDVDDSPDTSWIGEYTDTLETGVIVRRDNEFYEKLPREMERNDDGTFAGKGDFINPLPERGREFRGFKPYAGGEKAGTKEYYQYGMQDYERMEGLERGDWRFIGIRAIAKVGVSLDGGKNFKVDKITSGGLWGIESDAEDSDLKEIEQEQLSELKDLLLAYGFGRSKVGKAISEAEREEY
jgi:hypothetical protein